MQVSVRFKLKIDPMDFLKTWVVKVDVNRIANMLKKL